jgi:hypothetical protein
VSPRHRGRGHRGGAGGGAPHDGARPAPATIPNAPDETRKPDSANRSSARPTAGAPARTAGPGRPDGGNGPRPRSNAPHRRSRAAVAAGATPSGAPESDGENGENGENGEAAPARRSGCTLAQMRRFIKSRPYVPLHELRRRFLIEGDEDEVTPVVTDKGRLYVGLPATEAQHLAELIKAGEVGYELLLDPTSPAVVGVYPMRPVARQ